MIIYFTFNIPNLGTYTYQIPTNDFSVSKLFSDLIKNKEKHGIVDFGLSQTTLDDVFLNIAKHELEEK